MRMNCSLFLVAMVVAPCIFMQLALAEQRRPLLECTIVFTEGSFFGYGPPRIGNRANFDLNRLNDFKDLILIISKNDNSPYIPLPGPLIVEDEAHHHIGELERIRLTSISSSKSKGTKRKLTLDFQRTGGAGKGSNYFRLWIIDETPSISSVAKADCMASHKDG